MASALVPALLQVCPTCAHRLVLGKSAHPAYHVCMFVYLPGHETVLVPLPVILDTCQINNFQVDLQKAGLIQVNSGLCLLPKGMAITVSDDETARVPWTKSLDISPMGAACDFRCGICMASNPWVF